LRNPKFDDDSIHDNFTPDKAGVCPARINEILDGLVRGGKFAPKK
jgi:hypothetical protein